MAGAAALAGAYGVYRIGSHAMHGKFKHGKHKGWGGGKFRKSFKGMKGFKMGKHKWK